VSVPYIFLQKCGNRLLLSITEVQYLCLFFVRAPLAAIRHQQPVSFAKISFSTGALFCFPEE